MKFILEYIKKYKITYIGVIIVFIAGAVVGSLMIFKTSEDDKNEIKSYIENGVQVIQNNNEDKKEIFLESFLSDAKFIFVIGLLGCTVIAGFTIYLLIIYKGFLLGYIISIIINIFGISQGIKYLCILLVIRNILILPVMFLLATSGIRLYKGITKKELSLRYELIRHLIIIIVTIAFAIVTNCIQSYILVKFL